MSSLTLEPLTLEPVEVQWNPVEVMQNFDPVYRGLVSKSPQHRGTVDTPPSITPFKCSPQHRGTLDTPRQPVFKWWRQGLAVVVRYHGNYYWWKNNDGWKPISEAGVNKPLGYSEGLLDWFSLEYDTLPEATEIQLRKSCKGELPKSPLKELEDGVKQLRQEVEELKVDYQITPDSMRANPRTPDDGWPLPKFTDKPQEGVTKPTCVPMFGDESYELISKELEQEDFPQYEETYLQRFRRVVMGSNTLLNHNPYLTVPVVAISLATFGVE